MVVKLGLIGASGHGKVIAEIAEELHYEITGFSDQDESKSSVFEYPVNKELSKDTNRVVISIGNNSTRKRIAESNEDLVYIKLVHPKTTVSKRAQIGDGTVVMAGVTVNSDSAIGKHCIVNTNASIDHDCQIADYVHVSPNAALAGNVSIGEGTHIGIGASIIQGISIGRWCTIGAGAVIIRDVPDGCTVVGNPGKVIKKEEF